MAKFKVAVDHGSERQKIVDLLVGFADEMRSSVPADVNNVEENWDDQGNMSFSFSAMGFKISGDVITCASQVVVSGKLPFAALPFRGVIERTIEERLRDAIG